MAASVVPGASAPLAAGLSVWEVFDAWLRRASALIADSTEALNALNVFPVSDADTGSNLRLTLSGIVRAVPDVNRASVGAVVQAAILSAHGNSGAIVAEMFSSVCRSLEDDPAASSGPAGVRVARLLSTVAGAARRAVARPVAGTILTVADDAARAAVRAAESSPDDALAVAAAAQLEARAALARTPQQLEVLAAGGVVDAGGQAYALLLDALVEVLGGASAEPLTPGAAAPRTVAASGPEYEVMYALRGAGPDALGGLRERLSELGHSVVLAGDGRGEDPLVQVHVHLADPGAAVEAALPLGTLSQIRITALEPAAAGARTLVALVPGPGLAQAVRDAGAVAVQVEGDTACGNELRKAVQQVEGDVVVLPHDAATTVAATAALQQLRSGRPPVPPSRRLATLPVSSPVQALAALAVHEPTADFDTALAAMSAAVGHARHGAVELSPDGDLLGLVDGTVVLAGATAAEVAGRVAHRLLSAGGELLTLLPGVDAPEDLLADLERGVAADFPAVEVQVIPGGQPGVLVLGVE